MRIDAIQEDYYNRTFVDVHDERKIKETVGYHLDNCFNSYCSGNNKSAGTYIANSVLSALSIYEERGLNSKMELDEKYVEDFGTEGNLEELNAFLVCYSAFIKVLGSTDKKKLNNKVRDYIIACNQLCQATDMRDLEYYIEKVIME
jgi:hypothetical protein